MTDTVRTFGRRRLAACALLALADRALGQAPAVRRKLVLATRWPSPGSYLGTALALVYGEALRRMNLQLEMVVVPGRRAEQMVNSGEVDGELHRVRMYGEDRPSLLRVPTPHFSDHFVAYTARPLVLQNGWDSLKATSLLVDYTLGGAKIEMELQARVPAAQLHTVRSTESGLRKLLAGHSDVFVQVESAVEYMLQKPEFQGTPIRMAALMEKAEGYAYLHVKHRALLEPLARTLEAMHRDGTTERLRRQAASDEAH